MNQNIRTFSFALTALVCMATAPAAAHHESAPACTASAELGGLHQPLPVTAAAVRHDKRLMVVAIGSSSTAGYGATDASHAYPARLASELKLRWPGVEVSVVNKGVGGETAELMLARFDRDVLALKPQLVLWQLGSNSVLREGGFSAFEDALRSGVARIRAAHADVVLIDPQYAPRILARPSHVDVLRSLSAITNELSIARFQRFEIMRQWVTTGQVGSEFLLSPDQLHMSDIGYACIAHAIANGIEAAIGVEPVGVSLSAKVRRLAR